LPVTGPIPGPEANIPDRVILPSRVAAITTNMDAPRGQREIAMNLYFQRVHYASEHPARRIRWDRAPEVGHALITSLKRAGGVLKPE